MEDTNAEFGQCIRALKERFSLDFVGLARVLPAGRPFLAWPAAAGSLNDLYRFIVLAPGQDAAGMVLQRKTGMIIGDVSRDIPEEELREYPLMLAEKLESLYAVPLWRDEEVKGVLLTAFRRPRGFSPELLAGILAAIRPVFCGMEVREGKKAHEEAANTPLMPSRPPRVSLDEWFSYAVVQAGEEERKRISRELHDGVAQEIAAAQLRMRRAKYLDTKEEILEIIAQSDEHLGDIYKDIRDMAADFRPVLLQERGLASALRSFFAWIEEAYDTAVCFRENLGSERYAAEWELTFYRVCQEAVLNACKYAGGAEILVSLQGTDEGLLLEVRDGGRGLPKVFAGEGKNGMGLLSMRERAELIGGRLRIHSGPGAGTRVCLSVGAAQNRGGDNA